MDRSGPSLLEGIEEMRQRLSEVLTQVLPEELTARTMPQVDRVIASIKEKFQLVPREEFEHYMTRLKRLNEAVEGLSQRLTDLEQGAEQAHADPTDPPNDNA